MSNNIRIAVVDDHEIFGKAISDALMYENNFNVVFLAENGVELLFELDKNPVDIVILDLNMPVMAGKETLLLTKRKHPEIKIIVLSSYDDHYIILDSLKNGANAYLSKHCGIDELIDAIHGVMEKGFYFTEKFPQKLILEYTEKENGTLNTLKSKELSKRELDILRLICKEKCSREISESLHISERTVENHRYKISKKIGTSHGVGMLIYALQNGLAKITADGRIDFK